MRGPYRFANIPVTRLAIIFAAPTSFRQNIRTKPATAAKAEATGIRVSGPIYTRNAPVS